uniref:Uncharacterized protein n=1 Tax=Panagrolaimus sp. ES5 TaxID=591445 RepID=A0AC34FU55_9BILA
MSTFYKTVETQQSSDFSVKQNDSRFDNLNLNQNFDCSKLTSDSSFQTSNHKTFGLNRSDKNNFDQASNNSWSKKLASNISVHQQLSGLDNLNKKKQKVYRWEKDVDDSKNLKNSTLSLHIAAYENSLENTTNFEGKK